MAADSNHAGSLVLAIVGGMFLLIGSILSTVFCWGLPTDIGIDLRTKQIHGTVTSAEIARNVRINRQHPLCITYTYHVDGNTFTSSHDTVDRDYQDAYGHAGDDVPLEIDAGEPSRSRIQGTSHSTFGYGGALTLFFPLVGLVVLVAAVYTFVTESRSAVGAGGTASRARAPRARGRRDDRRR